MKPEREVEIVEMHEAGLPIRGIAEEMNVSATAIRNILKKYGRATTKAVEVIDEDDVIQRYLANEPVPEILIAHDITYGQLYHILRQHDIPTRKVATQDTREEQLSLAVELYQDGVPLWKIKEETGIHQPKLHAELHKRRIPLRRHRTRPGSFDSDSEAFGWKEGVRRHVARENLGTKAQTWVEGVLNGEDEEWDADEGGDAEVDREQ